MSGALDPTGVASAGAPSAAVAAAESAVRRARSRLAAAAAFDGASRGAVAGALVGLVVAGAALALGSPPPALVAVPLVTAAAGAAWTLRRRPAMDVAALALDRAAQTDEAFVTALTARDAEPWVRELTAERAVRICDRDHVPRAMPFVAPAAAAAAAVATALLAAVVLVPSRDERVRPVAPPAPGVAVTVPGGAGASGAAATSPRDRVGALAAAARSGDAAASERLRPAVRGDLGAVPDADLRALAEALAARGLPEAANALAALARGDRGAAIDALRAALGARDAGAASGTGGGETAGSVPGEPAPRPRSWGGGSWPLRYDLAIRRYFEEQH